MAWTTRLMLVTAWLASSAIAAVPRHTTQAIEPRVTDLARGVRVQIESQENAGLRKRQSNDDEETASPRPTGPSSTDSASGRPTTATPSSSPSSTSTTTTTQPALPSPFDISLGSYFTSNDGSNCPAFLHNLVTADDYKRCYPISMLIDTSQSWFEATRQLVSVVRVLDTACEADVDYCTEYFNGVAEDLLLDENCGQQYQDRLTIVRQAYDGLVSYELLYKATCLQDREDSQYCYANAVTGGNNASNVYPYYLPLNLTFPASATPSCNWCLEEMMGIFHAASEDRDLYIASTYEGAAKQINTVCGPEFVNATLPEARDTSLASFARPSWLSAAAALAAGTALLLT